MNRQIRVCIVEQCLQQRQNPLTMIKSSNQVGWFFILSSLASTEKYLLLDELSLFSTFTGVGTRMYVVFTVVFAD